MTALSVPTFAVVGHPNKGKSSIVATLAEDDRVAISRTPGTTRKARRHTFTLDGEALYTLVDTPGFQRPGEVLDWLKQHAGSASDRPEAVAAFVERHREDPRFADECELL
ncbi:MAG: GTPase, partial [Pseudomonadales bacterium]